jgi:hypothetical protein
LRFIASHDGLRHSVKTIRIFPWLFDIHRDYELDDFDYYSGRHSFEMCPPELAKERYGAYCQIMTEYHAIVTGGRLEQVLRDTLGRLSNLERLAQIYGHQEGQHQLTTDCHRIDWSSIKRRTGKEAFHRVKLPEYCACRTQATSRLNIILRSAISACNVSPRVLEDDLSLKSVS